MTNLTKVLTKAHKQFGEIYPARETDYAVRLVGKGKNAKITVFRKNPEGEYKEHRTFQVGDIAERDSYNLRYLGIITAITEKSVSISHSWRSAEGSQTRLNLNQFCWRNYNFNLEQAQRDNNETSYSI